MTPRILILAALAATALGGSAHAQMAVFDASNYSKAIEEATTALNQLHQLEQQVTQGEQLLNSLNVNSGVNALATALQQPALRNILPDISAFVAAGQNDLNGLGAIQSAAQSIRSQNRLYTPQAGDAIGADIEAQGNRAARDLAAGQAVATTAQTRLTSLQSLQTSLTTATDARAVMDLQARIEAEQAMIANDQMRLQGVVMAQAAEERLAQQRDRERMEAARDARIALYKAGFQ
jgi:type IV secretion system protein VirB5